MLLLVFRCGSQDICDINFISQLYMPKQDRYTKIDKKNQFISKKIEM